MPEQWLVDGPRVIDVGSERDRVEKVVVAIIGGTVDVVTHDDSFGARVEVSSVEGLPLRVSWDGRTLKVMHGKDAQTSVLDTLRRLVERVDGQRVEVSLSVPASAHVTLATVSAPIVANGLRRGLTANTVSGEMTISDVHGSTIVNTVSGSTECADLVGEVKLNSVSGAITVQGSDIPKARINTVSGEIALDLVNTHVDVQSNSVSGDVTIRAPFSGYAVTASSATGQVIVDGQSLRGGKRGRMPSGGTADGAPGQSGTLRSGAESLRLRANSVSGDVILLQGRHTGAGPGPQGWPPEGPQDAPPDGPQDGPPKEPQDGPPEGPPEGPTGGPGPSDWPDEPDDPDWPDEPDRPDWPEGPDGSGVPAAPQDSPSGDHLGAAAVPEGWDHR